MWELFNVLSNVQTLQTIANVFLSSAGLCRTQNMQSIQMHLSWKKG